jgi:NAD(P)-dependent dehydrogenase (short-subunit alcohol dehydrogenase family)
VPTAFVTGASRGIGKAIAVYLAKAGYDVAVSARTVQEGEQREHSSTLRKSDTSALPGSLASTVELVEAEGVRSLTVPADLTDRASVIAAANTVLEKWGPVDVLVNNGRYIGPGHMDRFVDTPLTLLDLHLEANAMAPLALIKEFLPGMLERGSGVIMNITSGAAVNDPPAPAGNGGWGIGYGFSKGALHRVAGILALELADRGILAYNIHPGFIATERMFQDMGAFGFDASGGPPPEVIGAAVVWILANPDAAEAYVGSDARYIEAQEVCVDRSLLPGWPSPDRPPAYGRA